MIGLDTNPMCEVCTDRQAIGVVEYASRVASAAPRRRYARWLCEACMGMIPERDKLALNVSPGRVQPWVDGERTTGLQG